MLSSPIPIFPLPNVVLFPGVFLPLHIFEPRYRAMVRDALSGDRVIGMVLLKPEGMDDYAGRPPVFPIGCAGLITHAERLPEDRYNIILRGLQRFRVVGEEHTRPYRLAHVDVLSDEVGGHDAAALERERRKLDRLIRMAGEHLAPEPRLSDAVTDEELINALAQYPRSRAAREARAARAGWGACALSLAHRTRRDETDHGADTVRPRRDSLSPNRALPIDEHLDDLIAMEAPVLDEDGRRVLPRDRAACDEEPRHVGLERLRIVAGDARHAVHLHTRPAEQIEVGMVARQQKHGVRRQLVDALARFDDDRRRAGSRGGGC